MTAETWVSTALAAALFVGLVVLTLAGRDRQGASHGRHAAPKCPCGCGRTPGQHTEPTAPLIPRQRRPL